MWRALITLIYCLFLCGLTKLSAQNNPDIIDGKDYNQSFYLKIKTSSSATYWRNRFPETWTDTSNTIRLPPGSALKFREDGTESSFGFSALFGLRWGKIGGGFESSRLTIDSLSASVGDTTLKLSYEDRKGRLGFNRFFVEFETNPIRVSPKEDFFLVIHLMAGTIVLSPVNSSVLVNTSVFFNLGPQLEVPLQHWLYLNLGTFYELRYFNRKEIFFSEKWLFHNTLHSAGFNLSLKFRIYNEDSIKQAPPERRVK